MNTFTKFFLTMLVLALAGTGLYKYMFRAPSAPSAEISAPEVAVSEGEEGQAGVTKKFTISQEKSTAEFRIDEVLRGSPFTVVGATNQIAGNFILNIEDFAKSEAGLMRVNARTLKTDSENRDGAIARFILKTEDPANEFIEFTPKSVTEFPDKINPGTLFTFKITGDLKISGVTRSQTFDVSATLVSDSEFTAEATTTLLYKDYGLTIPSVPFVASVEQEVSLMLKISASSLE